MNKYYCKERKKKNKSRNSNNLYVGIETVFPGPSKLESFILLLQ